MKALRFGSAILACALAVPALAAFAAAQEQSAPSLGDLARRIREQKKPSATPVRVWDNDSLPKTPNAVSTVGQPPPPEPTPAAKEGEKPAAPADANAPESTTREIADTASAVLDAKNILATLHADLDLLQRQYELDQQQFYSKPGFAADKDGKAKLDAEGAQVDAKHLQVQEQQQKIAALEQKFNELKASQPAPGEKPPSPGMPEQSSERP